MQSDVVSALHEGSLAFRALRSGRRRNRSGDNRRLTAEPVDTGEMEANMLRKLLVVAAAVAMPVSVVAVTGGVAGAKGPSAKTDTLVCNSISGSVTFSIPLTNAGNTTGGIETSTVNATVSGCTASGTFPVTVTSGTITGTFSSKPGSAKKPSAQCGALLGTSKNKGSVSTSWNSNPAVAPSTIGVKSVTGSVDGSQAQFQLNGSFKGSFGGSDKGKTSKSVSDTVETVGTLAGECAGSGIASINLQNPSSGPPLTLQ